MKKLVLMSLSAMLLLVVACKKEPVVKPSQKANSQVGEGGSGVDDPTKPPPHNGIRKVVDTAFNRHTMLAGVDSTDGSGVDDPTKPPPHGK